MNVLTDEKKKTAVYCAHIPETLKIIPKQFKLNIYFSLSHKDFYPTAPYRGLQIPLNKMSKGLRNEARENRAKTPSHGRLRKARDQMRVLRTTHAS